jgi:hypothetical protein
MTPFSLPVKFKLLDVPGLNVFEVATSFAAGETFVRCIAGHTHHVRVMDGGLAVRFGIEGIEAGIDRLILVIVEGSRELFRVLRPWSAAN